MQTEGGEQEVDELASKQPPVEAPLGLEPVVPAPAAAAAPLRLFVGERVTSSKSGGKAPASHQCAEEAAATSWPPPCC